MILQPWNWLDQIPIDGRSTLVAGVCYASLLHDASLRTDASAVDAYSETILPLVRFVFLLFSSLLFLFLPFFLSFFFFFYLHFFHRSWM